MSQVRWRIVGRRIGTAAKAWYHGISMVGFWEDAKTVKAWAGGLVASLVFSFEQVRDWLVDRATYLFALEQIGAYGPWLSGACMLFVLTRRAYLRGLPEVLEAEGLAEPREEPPAPVLPPRPDVDHEALVFRGLGEELFAVLEYLWERDGHSSYSLDLDGRRWALEDDLRKLDLQFPEQREEGARMLGLMKTGNLSRAREDFPLLPF